MFFALNVGKEQSILIKEDTLLYSVQCKVYIPSVVIFYTSQEKLCILHLTVTTLYCTFNSEHFVLKAFLLTLCIVNFTRSTLHSTLHSLVESTYAGLLFPNETRIFCAHRICYLIPIQSGQFKETKKILHMGDHLISRGVQIIAPKPIAALGETDIFLAMQLICLFAQSCKTIVTFVPMV